MEEKEVKKTLYEKKWFWLIILVLIIIMCIYRFVIRNSNTNTSSDYSNQIRNSENAENIKQNPFKVIDDYDGIYKFVLDSDNGSGNVFTSIGAILFNNGNCKIKYMTTSVKITSEIVKEYDGFCGKDLTNDSDFSFMLNDKDISYECAKTNNGFYCKLTSEFDLSGCTNQSLKLEKLEEAQDIDSVFKNIVGEEKKKRKEQQERQFKEECKKYSFEQLARNPDKMKDKKVKVTGEVIQVSEGIYTNGLRVNITKNEYDWYEDTIYVTYVPEEGKDKILEDDIITVWGTAEGEYSYTSVMGATITLPYISAEYLEIE